MRLGDSFAETIASQGATWHRICQEDSCHPSRHRRAKIRYEQLLAQRKQSQSAPIPLPSATNFKRSQSKPYDSNVCFFCEKKGSKRHPLSKVETDRASWHLHSAIEMSNNDNFHVKLSTAINPKDAYGYMSGPTLVVTSNINSMCIFGVYSSAELHTEVVIVTHFNG